MVSVVWTCLRVCIVPLQRMGLRAPASPMVCHFSGQAIPFLQERASYMKVCYVLCGQLTVDALDGYW